jgi:hypothetical protein
MPYEFLSDEWMDAVEKLAAEAPEPRPEIKDLTVNLVVTECPFGTREAHITAGHINRGLVEGAPTKFSAPYEVARALFVQGDPTAAMQAFMAGKIKVEGDMTKLMVMQTAGASPTEEEKAFQKKLQELTA